MYNSPVLWSIILYAAGVPLLKAVPHSTGNGTTEKEVRTADPSFDSVVAVKKTEPIGLVFIEHDGPYWTVGPVFERVREYMQTHNQPGPMFLRYILGPQVGAAGSPTSQVGFIVKGDHHPEPPFKTVQRDRELVAYMIVKDRSPTPWRNYRAIHEWIRSHGYEAAGPVTEIYEFVSPRVGTGPQRTEVQVSLRPQRERESAARSTSPLPTPRGVPHPSPQAKGEGLILSEDVSTDPISPPLRLRRNGAQAETIEPVSVLIAAHRFDQIAQQLMPDDHRLPATLQVWFGQVVFRIGAAAKGIEQVYPGEGRVVTGMADALTRRYRMVSVGFPVDPLAQAVVHVDVHLDPRARRKRAIMRRLDTLLGRIALRSAGADLALDELVEILQQVQDFLGTHRSQPSGTAKP